MTPARDMHGTIVPNPTFDAIQRISFFHGGAITRMFSGDPFSSDYRCERSHVYIAKRNCKALACAKYVLRPLADGLLAAVRSVQEMGNDDVDYHVRTHSPSLSRFGR